MCNKVSISKCKKDLQSILKILGEFQQDVVHLNAAQKFLDDFEWEQKIEKLLNTQKVILSNINTYKSTDVLNNLKQLLKRRQNRRNYIKRRNRKLKIAREKNLLHRKELHIRTSDWVEINFQKDLQEKQAKEDTKRSEIILYAVNKKISTAEKYINLFDGLEKLRKCRQNLQSNKYTNDTSFLTKLNALKNVWKDALTEYEDEKLKLQIFLNHTSKPMQHKWLETLFGKDFQSDLINTQTRSIHEFLNIRHAWDTFIVPEDCEFGSSIPAGWVLPNDEPDDRWNLYK